MTAPQLLNPTESPVEVHARNRILTLSTAAFTLMFAVWLQFGVLGIPIRKEFGLSDVQLSWLAAVAILNGSVWRLAFGILTDKFGGRRVMAALLLLTSIPTYLVTTATSFTQLLVYAFLLGLSGNSFNVGISWNSAWFPKHRQGFALGVFGAGNVGASVTKLIGPALITMVPVAGVMGGLVPGGWRFVPVLYAAMLVVMAALIWFFTPSHDRKPGAGRPLHELLRPLRFVRVWRFSLYYVVVFGAYVALSAWLPKYYVDVYGLPLATAALLTTLFIFPASLLRPFGGWMSDRFGARRVMYGVFWVMTLSLIMLAAPSGHIVLYVPQQFESDGTREVMQFQLGVGWFTVFVFLLGVGMGVGKAAVYKHIPEYFPKDVGAVGGLVGLIGALGGFFLPPFFAYSYSLAGIPQTTFFILLVVTAASFIWMHWTVLGILRSASPELEHKFESPGDRLAPGSRPA
ncbi:MAG: NarK/NasA family nitrate transporter [Acidobacteria bacterium]|nr:NarK/NasA family nitrate transporter [Acidobacteriota bacterium]